MTIPIQILLYLSFGGLLALHLYYDRRTGRGLNRSGKTAAHHCIRCDHLYSARKDDQLHECPKCGYANPRLKY